ncbi:MAG: hypothetical protein U1F53_23775 [Burkholderiaceae bacterium]
MAKHYATQMHLAPTINAEELLEDKDNMAAIPVKMCCHAPGDPPKFEAALGDTILFRGVDGSIHEVVIEGLDGATPSYRNSAGMLVHVSPETILAVYMV